MYTLDDAYCLQIFRNLLDIDSTTGQYEQIQAYVCGLLDEMNIEM